MTTISPGFTRAGRLLRGLGPSQNCNTKKLISNFNMNRQAAETRHQIRAPRLGKGSHTRLWAVGASGSGSLFLALILVLSLGTGCSIRKLAMNKLGDALSQGGTTFANDDDPDFIRQAVPFSLKLMESLLAEDPKHLGLLQSAARGFTQYSFAFIQEDADEVEDQDLAKANALRVRARNMYLRARNYGLRGLEVHHPNLLSRIRAQDKQAALAITKEEVPFLYWTALSWAAAISLSKDDPESVADVPVVEVLADRALALEESYDWGSLHGFMVNFESARKNVSGDLAARIKAHFDRAVELSHGQLAGPFVAFAEAVSVQKQDLPQFRALLERALAIDVKARPEWQVENLVMQRRARWLLSRTETLFLVPDKKDEPAS